MQDAASPTRPAAAAAAATTETKKRPRLDLTTDSRERKRGKTMFGLVLGTLNKAKNEDRERQNSEAVCALCYRCWCKRADGGARRPRRDS